MKKSGKITKPLRLLSPWIVTGTFVILLSIIFVFAFRNADKVSFHMSRVLIEKGQALIKSFEAGTRTGMMGRYWSDQQIQKLIDETSSLPDILYIFISDNNGVVRAHSSSLKTGTKVDINQALNSLKMGEESTWRIVETAKGADAFEVYSYFKPIGGSRHSGRMHSQVNMKHHRGSPGWDNNPENTDTAPHIIFIGLDMRHFEEARKTEIRDSILISFILLIFGISGFVSLFWFQSYRIANLEEVRALQEEVRRNEKLAAMGSLSAGIAHEIRNPLSSIKGLATFLGALFPEGSDNREIAEVMIQEVERINKVITELLELSKPSDIKRLATNLRPVIDKTVRLIRQDAEIKNIQIRVNCPDVLPGITADPDKLSQTFLNLFINAIQSMENGGKLDVTLALNVDGDIEIKIKDTGSGIDKENIEKIFNPYFTTKKSGTGLGLAIVCKIIEAHNGIVNVQSSQGTGTEFTITLPTNKDL